MSTPDNSTSGAATLTALPDHPFAALFPMIEGDDYERIKEDLRVFGQKNDIVAFEGAVLDGRNRQKMLLELGVAPNFRTFDPDAEGDALEFVLSNNLQRRDMTPSQKAMVAADLEEKFAEAYKTRRARIEAAPTGPGYDKDPDADTGDGQPAPGDSTIDTTGDFAQVPPKKGKAGKPAGKDSDETRSRAKAGKALGVSARAVGDAKKLKKQDPAAAAEVKAGKKTLNAAMTGKATPGSTAAADYEAALVRIEAICGKPLAKAIKEGARLKNRKDVIGYAAMTDDKMLDIRNLIEQGWALKKAALYKAVDLLPTHRIIDGITRAAADGGKSFTASIETPEMGCDWEVTFKPKARPKAAPAPTFAEKVAAAKVGDVIEDEKPAKGKRGAAPKSGLQKAAAAAKATRQPAKKKG